MLLIALFLYLYVIIAVCVNLYVTYIFINKFMLFIAFFLNVYLIYSFIAAQHVSSSCFCPKTLGLGAGSGHWHLGSWSLDYWSVVSSEALQDFRCGRK